MKACREDGVGRGAQEARRNGAVTQRGRSQGGVGDGDGIPVCSEMWPGNTTDVTTLDQVAQRLHSRFGVRRVCLVADAGMISKKMIAAVEARGWFYILGARLRRTKEVRDVVLSDTGAFETVEVARQRPDPMELQVKEVTVNDTPCATFFGTVDEADPVEVIHMSSRAGTHETGGHHGKAVEASPLVQPLPVHEAPRTLGPVAAAGLLHDEPFREPPCADAFRGRPGLVRLRRRRVEHRRRDTGHCAELAGQPGSTISSRLPGFGHVSSPPTIAECLGRSMRAPGP